MSWNTMGTITVSENWQSFNTATLATAFRLTFLGDLDRVWYHARLRQQYATDEVSPSVLIYPKPEKLIIELTIPEALIQQGTVVRYLSVKKFPDRRGTVIDSNWSIILEELL